MAQDQSTDRPTERLVQIIRTGTDAERAQAWQELVPLIDKRVLAVARIKRFSPVICQDLSEIAVGHVFEKLDRWDSEKSRFDTWLGVVLLHLAIDLMRRKSRNPIDQSQTGSTMPDRDAESTATVETRLELAWRPQAEIDLALDIDFNSPLGEADLSVLKRMPVVTRVVGVACGMMSRKIPETLWQTWLEECGIDPPELPVDWDAMRSNQKRLEWLADAMGRSVTGVRQRWQRLQHAGTLRKLQFVRGLCDA